MFPVEPAQSFAAVEIHNRSGSSCIAQNKLCPGWIVDNFDRYTHPLLQHVYLTVVSVGIGFAIAFSLALLAHRRRWLVGPIVGLTGVLYTLPSLAVFFLLLPITGRGTTTAVAALTAYTLQIIFRNVVAGLDNVPAEAKDAGLGSGLTDRQLLWRVELPLAASVIIAGVRVATVIGIGVATIAAAIGAGGLGVFIFRGVAMVDNRTILAGALPAAVLAVGAELALGAVERRVKPPR
jgi:osmoprotectant transport system permease protein